MKKYLLLYKILFLGITGHAQLTITPGTNWVNTGNVTVLLQNMDFINNGTYTAGSSSMKFTGNQNSNISGNTLPVFYILEIGKTNSAKVLLTRNSSVSSSINFISGQLDLNNNNILLNSSAFIAGESENNRIIGSTGGVIEITQDMNAPASVNAGNLGATISSSANLGTVTIRRGHLPQSGAGLTTGIHRYYSIIPQNNNGLNATVRLRYFEGELNSQNENSLVIYKSNDDGANWDNMSQSTRNTNANYVEKTGMETLGLQTLANDNVVIPDGAVGVVLAGQRKKATEVTLKWGSQSETNMSGYQVERKLDTEPDFTNRAFVNTLVPGGNSFSQLSYQDIDANAHTGISHYRLKIMTTGNTFTYSNVISVAGKTKGGGNGNSNGNNLVADTELTTATGKTEAQLTSLTNKITVGPNPNNGHFWFSVTGPEKETTATLFTIDGKQIKQFKVAHMRRQQVNGIRTGIYLLKVPGFETQKIIVHGGGSNSPAAQPVIDNSLKFK